MRARQTLLRCVAAAVLAVAGTSPVAAAGAVNDLLLLPAIRSDSAASSMLLGVARAGTRLVAVGERGHIVTSDDDGATWAQASVPTSVTLTAVDFPTPAKGWAVGHDGVVLHTSDGGKRWVKQLDGAQANRLVLAQIDKILAAKKASGGEQKVLRSLELLQKDAAAAMADGSSRPFLDVWFRNEREGFVVGAFGTILRTVDGGGGWAPILDRIENPDGYHYYALGRAGGTLLLAGEAGLLFRSDDFGASWVRLKPPYEGSYFGIAGGAGTAVAFGLRGHAVKSTDAGQRWELIATPANSALSGGRVFSDGALWLVARDGEVLRSVDAGKTFSVLRERFEGAAAIVEAADGSAVLVGTRGAKRIRRD